MTEDEETRLRDILSTGMLNIGALNNWERSFLKDQVQRYEAEGALMFLSRKQWESLERIADKLGMGSNGAT